MQVTSLDLSKIKPYYQNNRIYPEAQIILIANSIKEFGFNQPIVIDEKNVILVGHGRLLAAQKLELKEAPVIKLTKLSLAQKRAYRILDNKLQNDSTWDLDNLAIELDALKDCDFDLDVWGLNDLKERIPEAEQEVVEDDGPGELPEKPYIKLSVINITNDKTKRSERQA